MVPRYWMYSVRPARSTGCQVLAWLLKMPELHLRGGQTHRLWIALAIGVPVSIDGSAIALTQLMTG